MCLLSAFAGTTKAQEDFTEEPDATRLDVERLPPEAIQVSRDMYAKGFFFEGHIGVNVLLSDLGEISNAGPTLSVGMGYEFTRWLALKLSFAASLHKTAAPAPPSPTVFELMGVLAELRFNINASSRFALWFGGEVGLSWSLSDVLRTYGFTGAQTVGLVAGGVMGLDWHLRNRHNSVGIAGGARIHTNFSLQDGPVGLSAYGSLYLRHVF